MCLSFHVYASDTNAVHPFFTRIGRRNDKALLADQCPYISDVTAALPSQPKGSMNWIQEYIGLSLAIRSPESHRVHCTLQGVSP